MLQKLILVGNVLTLTNTFRKFVFDFINVYKPMQYCNKSEKTSTKAFTNSTEVLNRFLILQCGFLITQSITGTKMENLIQRNKYIVMKD